MKTQDKCQMCFQVPGYLPLITLPPELSQGFPSLKGKPLCSQCAPVVVILGALAGLEKKHKGNKEIVNLLGKSADWVRSQRAIQALEEASQKV